MVESEVQVKGHIKWFNNEKGYGFIRPADGSPDVFVHKRHLAKLGIHRRLREEEPVVYSAKKGDKGLEVSALTVGP